MAKRQNFIVGSTNTNTEAQTVTQLNEAWNRYDVLYSGKLDGVFNAVSDYSNDSSNEIANAILSITGSQPTGQSQTELAGALNQMRQDIETSSLTFKGYIATSAPSSSTYVLIEGNLWINSATLPTSFPVAASNIKIWDGSAWVSQSNAYTAADFDFWRNVNDNEGYYWFGGQWVVMSTDMSTTYFTLNQTSGKWEIKSSVNLPGQPTAATPTDQSPNTQIATKQYVDEAIGGSGTGRNVGDIFFTTRKDTELNGAVECNGGTYNTGDFAQAQAIGALLEAGKVPYVTLSQYTTLLSTNGSVGVFGWDGTGTTTFRVPSLTDIFLETGTAAQIGDYLAPALPNITGQFSATRGAAESGAFTSGGQKDLGQPWDGRGLGSSYVNFNASDSSAVYQNDATVQPNAVRYRAMVQLAISASDQALATCTSVMSQVASNTSAINGADYVVASQLPTALNNYTWYRKYKSGWVEQGGVTSTDGTQTLPVEMADTNYTALRTNENGRAGTAANELYTSITQKATTSIYLSLDANIAPVSWEVKGVAASNA